MFEFLLPKDGPVFDGLEGEELVIGAEQPQYLPLRTLVSAGPDRKTISRWTLTPEQRKAIADGADIFLELATFGNPLIPIRIMVTDDKDANGHPLHRDWVRQQLLDREVLTMHCERCQRECYFPSPEQIAEHERLYGKMDNPEFLCDDCKVKTEA